MKFSAKRIDAGSYEYRGFSIQDHGAGNSVHAAMMRNGSRWKVRRITGPGFFDSEAEPSLSDWTLSGAKKNIDSALAKVDTK